VKNSNILYLSGCDAYSGALAKASDLRSMSQGSTPGRPPVEIFSKPVGTSPNVSGSPKVRRAKIICCACFAPTDVCWREDNLQQRVQQDAFCAGLKTTKIVFGRSSAMGGGTGECGDTVYPALLRPVPRRGYTKFTFDFSTWKLYFLYSLLLQ